MNIIMANIATILGFIFSCIGMVAAAPDNVTAGKLNKHDKWKFQQYRDFKIEFVIPVISILFRQDIVTRISYDGMNIFVWDPIKTR